jgi:hypothetical protein
MKDLKKIQEFFSKPLNEYSDEDFDSLEDAIANAEFGMDYDQLGPGEKEWVDDEMSMNEDLESLDETTILESVYTDPNTGKNYDLQYVSSKNRWELDIMKKDSSIYDKITTIKRDHIDDIIDWLDGYNIDSSWVMPKVNESVVEKVMDTSMLNEASKGAKNYFDDLKFNYEKAFRYLEADEKEEYKLLVKNFFSKLNESIVEKVITQLKEGKPGLWANIRAKKARGGKPAHGNSDAHKTAVKAGKKINKLKEEEGVPHYTKDGKEWKGKLHKMPDGSLMSGNPHDENGSGPNGKSEKLFHKEDLNEIEDNGSEEKSFDAELMAAANGIAATLGKELKAKQGEKEQLDEAVVTSIIAAVLTGNALIGFISKMSKKLAKKFNWKKGEDFADKVHKWAHDNEVAFQKPIKRILKFFIKDEAKLEATTKGIYALIIISMAAGYGAEAASSLSHASWFKASIAALKGIAKGDEAIVTAYPILKSFIA